MTPRERTASIPSTLADDPLWYKDAVIYELHVRTFFDSNDDGLGDFPGLTEKLDYLEDLGVNALWLLPFYPSPWKDDGYDIAGYTDVHPAYGNVSDFRRFLREARGRGLRVITELVINHTSDQHPWFQRARRSRPGSAARDFYVWSDTPEKYRDARIIFKDFEPSNWAWDGVARAYFWHRFYSQQPDLNYDNPRVHEAVFKAMDFWFRMGVDGMRLDAIPYLYEREGTNCENLPETHAFLKQLRARLDQRFPNRMLLAEANQWPEDAVAYFGEGDECHASFHFPVMPRLYMAIQMEDRFPILDILEQTPPIPENCQWATFLRNHDELTLEMVTDEERDYMYRMYAHDPQMRINLGIRRRLAPLLQNDRRKIELMKSLLFSLPGTPVLYYGDEIGMGDNIYLGDRNAVRTPMQWSADRNAGFSRANPQRLYLPVIIDPEYHFEAVNVENQLGNPHSLFWWTKRLIALRRRYQAFGRGSLEFLHPDNPRVLAFVRSYERERILVVANLSRLVQCLELDLGAFRGAVPVELFGGSEMPPVRDQPYFLTLAPYGFYWFSLEPQPARQRPLEVDTPAERVPALALASEWTHELGEPERGALVRMLPDFVRRQRWFGGKARSIREVQIRDVIPLRSRDALGHVVLFDVLYREGNPDSYILPLALASGEWAVMIEHDQPQAIVARVNGGEGNGGGLIIDALVDRRFASALLDFVVARRRARGDAGMLAGVPTSHLQAALAGVGSGGGTRRSRSRGARTLKSTPKLPPSVLRAEQSNTSVVYGDRLILKVFRRSEPGLNPDLEIGRYLTERGFGSIPPVAGAIEYRDGRSQPVTVGILQGFVTNEGDAWRYTLDALGRYFECILTSRPALAVQVPAGATAVLDLLDTGVPDEADAVIGTYLESARILGQRTAELHQHLGAATNDPGFSPEPFGLLYQRSLYQSMRNLTGRTYRLLDRQLYALPERVRPNAERVRALRGEVLRQFRAIVGAKLSGLRTRIHGDYHLGQVLFTGKDFVIIDFEGEPARPLSERRLKRSPLVDVAGMLRSFSYAAQASLYELEARGAVRQNDLDALAPWALLWRQSVGTTFLRAYLAGAQGGGFLPNTTDELRTLLKVYLLEKAVYELAYELNHRPAWASIPIEGILQVVES